MGCGASSSANDVTYINGKPTFKGDQVTKGFDKKENGLLFRIVDSKKQMWAYYNDTLEYEMHVEVTFNSDCDIKALGKTSLEKLSNGDYLGRVVVYPTETEMFIQGRVNGFKSKMNALPLSAEYKARQANKA